MLSPERCVMLNPIQALLDDGCPNYQGVYELPIFVPLDLDPPDHDGRIDDDAHVIDVE
jgi:hypothetical protein